MLQPSRKRKKSDSTNTRPKKKRKKKKKEEDAFDPNDKFNFLDDPNYGLNEKYEEESQAYNEQQAEKRKRVKEDPTASTITYVKSDLAEDELTVRSFPWMKDNWADVKGNTTYGTYAMRWTVDGQPFYFRANNTNDVGLAPMALGSEDNTYVSSTIRPFTTIGGELDAFIGKSRTLRKKIGASILKGIKDQKEFGCTTTGITTLSDANLYAVQSMIAEVAAIWALDLCRSEGNDEAILEHQEDLLLGTKTFSYIFTPGVYLGMKAATLRKQ